MNNMKELAPKLTGFNDQLGSFHGNLKKFRKETDHLIDSFLKLKHNQVKTKKGLLHATCRSSNVQMGANMEPSSNYNS